MFRKLVSRLILALFLIGMLTSFLSAETCRVVGVNSNLPVHNVDTGLDYPTIQDAINANETLDGHTILVDLGTYTETVAINKSLTLKGKSNQDTTLIVRKETEGLMWGMRITTSNVVVEGFNITYELPGTILIVVYSQLYSHPWNETVPDCTNVTIRDNIITGSGTDTVALRNADGNRITNNTIFCGAGLGIGLLTANNNIVSNNVITGGWADVVFQWGASNNTVIYNTIADQVQRDGLGGAITAAESAQCNLIYGNNLTNNEVAMWFVSPNVNSSMNIIYHNNFINNTQNVVTEGEPNTWDSGYPAGGNYWSDYAGNDTYSGPNQDQPGSDGIGDTPYVVDEDYTDRYPLMQPYDPLTGDINQDWKIDLLDALQLASAFGSYPMHPRWNIWADIQQDGTVDIYDAILLCRNFGNHR